MNLAPGRVTLDEGKVPLELAGPASLRSLVALISRKRRWQFVGLFAAMLLGAAAEMVSLGAILPFLTLLSTDEPLTHPLIAPFNRVAKLDGSSLIAYSALVFAVISAIAAVIRLFVAWLTFRCSFAIGRDLGSVLFLRVLSKPYAWHIDHNSSETLAAFSKINTVVSQVIAPCMQAIVASVVIAALLTTLLLLDWEAALLTMGGLLLIYGSTSLAAKGMLTRNSSVIAKGETERIRVVQEGLGGIRDVLLDRVQRVHLRRFEVLDRKMRDAQATNHFLGSAPRFIVESAAMVVIVAVAYFMWARTGNLSNVIPALGIIALGAQKLMPQLQQLYLAWSSIKGNRDALSDVLALVNETSVTTTPLRPSRVTRQDGQVATRAFIQIYDVSFAYGLHKPRVLDRVSLSIGRGQHVGFMGKTGCGKSTLLDILMGLQTPTEGWIEIDGEPLTESNMHAWQDRVAHVPQSIYLADCSIAENIAFGVERDLVDMARVRSAAQRAHLSDYIEQMPQGYETAVGERGMQLSGGQRQRIGIARALYKRAEIIVLDEATSALDNATESAVMTSIRELGSKITVLMVAHRTSTLSECDQTFKVRDGKIIKASISSGE